MELLVAILTCLFAGYLALSIMRHCKYIQLRFKLFQLRDEILWLAMEGKVPKDEAIKLHNTINWAVRYVREFPVFFLFGLVMAFEELNLPEKQEELRVKLDEMSPDLKDWYFQWSELTLEGIKTYTPLENLFMYSRLLRSNIYSFAIPFALWLIVKLVSFRKHPLSRSVFGQFSFKRAKEQTVALSRTRETAWHIKDIKMGMA